MGRRKREKEGNEKRSKNKWARIKKRRKIIRYHLGEDDVQQRQQNFADDVGVKSCLCLKKKRHYHQMKRG